MKVIDILNARDSLVKLIKVKFTDFNTTYGVYKLVKKVDSVYDMIQNEQEKLISIYADKDECGNIIMANGNYSFTSKENRENFLREFTNFRNEEIDDIEKLPIKIDILKESSELSSEDMLKLDAIIDWIE